MAGTKDLLNIVKKAGTDVKSTAARNPLATVALSGAAAGTAYQASEAMKSPEEEPKDLQLLLPETEEQLRRQAEEKKSLTAEFGEMPPSAQGEDLDEPKRDVAARHQELLNRAMEMVGIEESKRGTEEARKALQDRLTDPNSDLAEQLARTQEFKKLQEAAELASTATGVPGKQQTAEEARARVIPKVLTPADVREAEAQGATETYKRMMNSAAELVGLTASEEPTGAPILQKVSFVHLPEQERSVYEQRLNELKASRIEAIQDWKSKKEQLGWREVFEKLGQAISLFAVAEYGTKHGVDAVSGLKFNPTDWAKQYEMAYREFKDEVDFYRESEKLTTKSMEERRQAYQDVADENVKLTNEERKARFQERRREFDRKREQAMKLTELMAKSSERNVDDINRLLVQDWKAQTRAMERAENRADKMVGQVERNLDEDEKRINEALMKDWMERRRALERDKDRAFRLAQVMAQQESKDGKIDTKKKSQSLERARANLERENRNRANALKQLQLDLQDVSEGKQKYSAVANRVNQSMIKAQMTMPFMQAVKAAGEGGFLVSKKQQAERMLKYVEANIQELERPIQMPGDAEASGQSEGLRVRLSDGSVGTIPREQLQEFLREYPDATVLE